MARSLHALRKGDMLVHATKEHMVIRRNNGDVEIFELLRNEENGRTYSKHYLTVGEELDEVV